MLKHDILRNIFLIVMSVPVSIFYGLKGFCEEFCGVWEDTFDSIKDKFGRYPEIKREFDVKIN